MSQQQDYDLYLKEMQVESQKCAENAQRELEAQYKDEDDFDPLHIFH